MITLDIKTIPIDSFFEFAAGKEPFDLIDILEETTQNGDKEPNSEFVYATHFLINRELADQLGIIGIRFDISTVDPQTRTLQINDIVKSDSVLFSRVPRVAFQKDGEDTDDILSWQKINGQLKKVIVGKQTTTTLPGIPVPGTERLGSQNLSFKQASTQDKLNGKDPASSASTGNFSAVTPANAMSLDSSNEFPASSCPCLDVESTLNNGQSLLSFRNEHRRQRRSMQDSAVAMALSSPKKTSVAASSFFELIPSKLDFMKNIAIKRSSIAGASRIFVTVTAIANHSVVGASPDGLGHSNEWTKRLFQPKYVQVMHGNEETEFLSNPEPPDLSLLQAGFSSVSIKLRRVDRSLHRVRIVRVITNLSLNTTAANDVDDLSFDDSDTLIFTDVVDNIKPNRIVYRVAVVNGDGSIGEFSSIVIPSFKKISDPLNTAGVPVSIRAVNTYESVQIRVTTLTDGIYTLRLLRQEFGKTGSLSDSVEVVPSDNGETLIIVAGQIGSFEFVDKTSILGRKYRYFVALRVGDSGMASLAEEIVSDEDEVLERKFYTGSVPFAISVSDPTLEQGSDDSSTVSFEITVKETSDLFSAVTKSLQDAGIGAEFISNLQKDDVKTKLFTMFLVERFEVATGRRVSFGIVSAGRFTDSPESRISRSIPPPKPGGRYEYIIKTCLQQPEVFLQSSNVGLVNRYGDEIKRKGNRFARLIYSSLGVMPPEIDIHDGKTMEALLLESQIGQEHLAEVSIPTASPAISAVSIIEKSFYNSLTWRVSGNIDSISYFLVFCTLNGHEQLLGSVACSRSSPTYRFRDDRFFAEVGEKSYNVKAVSFNDDEVVKSSPAASNKLFSIPENLVVGTMFSSFGNKSQVKPVALEDFSPSAKKAPPASLPTVTKPSPIDAPLFSTIPTSTKNLQVASVVPFFGNSKPIQSIQVLSAYNENPAAWALASNVDVGKKSARKPKKNIGDRR